MCPVVVPPGNPIIEARDEILSEGNETEMTCTAMSSKPAATIKWMKGDKELPGRSLNTIRHFSRTEYLSESSESRIREKGR